MKAIKKFIFLLKKHLYALQNDTNEVEAAVVVVVFVLLAVLPIIPDHAIDPWNLFNPRRFVWLIAIIATIQFSSHLVIRIFGKRFGMLLIGFLGGVISSTALFLTLPDMMRVQPTQIRSITAVGIISIVGMLVEICIILFVAAFSLFKLLILPLVSMVLIGCFFSFFLVLTQQDHQAELTTKMNPLGFYSTIRLSLFIGVVFVLVELAKHYIGGGGVFLIAFLSGLFEVHSVTLATSLLFLGKELTLSQAGKVLAMAIFASYFSKFFIIWVLDHQKLARWISFFLIIQLMSGGIVYLFLI